MKALEKLFNKAIKNPDSDYCEITKCYEKVKSALERKEKLEKAMELIDKKQVAWGLIIRCQSAEEYNKWTHDYHITQEEYDFLRTFVHKESEEK